jgi:hypothetical protein
MDTRCSFPSQSVCLRSKASVQAKATPTMLFHLLLLIFLLFTKNSEKASTAKVEAKAKELGLSQFLQKTKLKLVR